MAIKGGAKFKAALDEISKGVRDGGLLRVGFLEGATYPARERKALRAAYKRREAKGNTRTFKGAEGGMPVAAVAFFQEFGTGTIPPRPFFRNMIASKSSEWGPTLAIQLKKTNYNVKKSLDVLGSGIDGQLKQSIIDTNTPPLKESTVRRKGFSKPLIDTSHLINSIDHEVVK